MEFSVGMRGISLRWRDPAGFIEDSVMPLRLCDILCLCRRVKKSG
jgi:hypothetical protein